MVEKRTTNRKRVFKAGTIEFGGSAIDCTIRNVSKDGAALDVASPVGIPEKFALVLPSDGLIPVAIFGESKAGSAWCLSDSPAAHGTIGTTPASSRGGDAPLARRHPLTGPHQPNPAPP
jgi:hypothetical protein